MAAIGKYGSAAGECASVGRSIPSFLTVIEFLDEILAMNASEDDMTYPVDMFYDFEKRSWMDGLYKTEVDLQWTDRFGYGQYPMLNDWLVDSPLG